MEQSGGVPPPDAGQGGPGDPRPPADKVMLAGRGVIGGLVS